MSLTKPFKFLLFLILISTSSAEATANKNTLNKLINQISNRVVETVVSLARTQAEVSYETVTYNGTLGSIFLDGLRVVPHSSSGLDGCVISIGTIGFSLYRNDFSSKDNIDSGLTDVKISPLCLPLEMRGFLAIAGIREMHFPAARVKLTHHYPSSATSLTLFISLHDTATVSANADFSYLSFSEETSFPFVAKLKSAEFSIVNDGMWESARSQLPPAYTTPGLASDSFGEAIRTALNSGTSYKTIEYIIENFTPAIDEFLKDPKKLTVMTQVPHDGHIELSIKTFDRIETIINALRPVLVANHKNEFHLLPATKLLAAMKGNTQSLTDIEILNLADLFVQGKHVPKNNQIAEKLLEDLGKRDVVEAFRALAEIQIKIHDYESAYFNALKLSAHEQSSAAGLINQLENELPLDIVISIQDKFLPTILDSSSQRGIDYFDKALAHLNGSGSTKSYLGAYYFALLAKADGDVRSEFIVDKVEELSSGFIGSKSNEWLRKITEIQSKATSTWLELQLSSHIESND